MTMKTNDDLDATMLKLEAHEQKLYSLAGKQAKELQAAFNNLDDDTMELTIILNKKQYQLDLCHVDVIEHIHDMLTNIIRLSEKLH